MFLTTHAAAGIAISQYVDNPLAVFGLAFASHFVLDFIPHGDENLYGDYELPGNKKMRKAIVVNTIDVTALTLLTLWAISYPTTGGDQLMLIGILGAILPDFISHLFPILHERLSWLFLVRWLYAITKPTGLRYFARAQNSIHRFFHHSVIRSDVSLSTGLFIQMAIVTIVLSLVS